MKFVIGNLKMNLETLTARDEYLRDAQSVFADLTELQQNAIAVCPPFVYIESFVQELGDVNAAIGAQDAHYEFRGKHTGEISPKMLSSLGVSLVILGHSERRAAGEMNVDVIKKVAKVLEAGLTPVVCVGYCEDEQEEGRCIEIRVKEIAMSLDRTQIGRVIFAYEPVWAIGTGKTPSEEHIHTMTLVIRKAIVGVHGIDAGNLPVLYGGSVTTENVRTICEKGFVDGVLVGGASLKPENLARMSKLLN